MRHPRLYVPALAAVALTALGGCQMFGPNSIDVGRGRYNAIIQSTSMEQTMSNIVRVYNHEPPMFMDVTEVDATVSFGGSLNGATTNIGAKRGTSGGTLAGQVGSATGTVQYSETPTIRYQPLLGQALVAQLVTPVSADALGLLYDSNWDTASLLDFSVQYMTLDPHEFYSALDTIEELASGEAVELGAAPSNLPKPAAPQDDAQAGSTSKKTNSSATGNNSLVIYLLPFREIQNSDDKKRVLQLWVRMFRFYYQNQPPFNPPSPKKCTTLGLLLNRQSLRNWDVNIDQYVTGKEADKSQLLDDARDCLPNFIELRVVPAPIAPRGTNATPTASKVKGKSAKASKQEGNGDSASAPKQIATHVPLMRTFSALGILKNATERPHPLIEFVTPGQYQRIRFDEQWNKPVEQLNYYTLLPTDLDSVDCPNGGCDSAFPPSMPKEFIQKLDADIKLWLQAFDPHNPSASYPNGISVYEQPGKDVLGSDYLAYNGRLGTLKRFILIIVDDHLPSGPIYASYSDGQRWYYIAKDDAVSEKNFQLLSLFMSMMAVPPSTQPLSPVINVGG